jgi:hypothetical protein
MEKTEGLNENEAFLAEAIAVGQRSVAFQRYIQNSNCHSEKGMARMAGLVAFEYLAERGAALRDAIVAENTRQPPAPAWVKIGEAARDVMWEPDSWEQFQDMKTSNSADIPTAFMELGHLIEEMFGQPNLEQENNG